MSCIFSVSKLHATTAASSNNADAFRCMITSHTVSTNQASDMHAETRSLSVMQCRQT